MFDLHCLHLGRVEWLSVRVGGTVPDGRINHTLCCYGRTLYLFGGAFKGVPSHEVYALYTDEHRSLLRLAPPSFSSPNAPPDSVCTHAGEPRWELLSTSGLTPEPRSSHTALMVKHNMLVFGGNKCVSTGTPFAHVY